MSDNPDPPPLPDWVEVMMPGQQEASQRHGLPRPDQVPEASGTEAAHPFLTPVKSSNISGVAHDGQALWVKFQNGGLYRYPTAGADLHQGLLAAESAGQFFHKHVKSTHKGEKVS